MSRHGYSDDVEDDWATIRWRGAVASAIRGNRGQALLREMRDALDAMPEKRLIAHELVTKDGDRCALGCVAVARGLDVSNVDPEESDQVAKAFGVSEALVREITYWNDDDYGPQTPEDRWRRMRRWVDRQIKKPAESTSN